MEILVSTIGNTEYRIKGFNIIVERFDSLIVFEMHMLWFLFSLIIRLLRNIYYGGFHGIFDLVQLLRSRIPYISSCNYDYSNLEYRDGSKKSFKLFYKMKKVRNGL